MIKVSSAQFEQDVIINILEKLAAAGNPNTPAPGFMDRLRKVISDHAIGLGLLGGVATAGTAIPAASHVAGMFEEKPQDLAGHPMNVAEATKNVEQSTAEINKAKRLQNTEKIVNGLKSQVDSNYLKLKSEPARPPETKPSPKVDLTHTLKPFMSLKGKK